MLMFFAWTVISVFFHLFVFLLPKKFFFIIMRSYFKGLTLFFGIKINLNGDKLKNNVIYFCNHTSYLDILILGSELNALFVAKSEIAEWPIINKLTALGKTIFVNRKRQLKARSQVSKISKFFDSGYNIIIFPEGTSGDGTRILPFKSSLFEIAMTSRNKEIQVQPISLTYTSLDGLPINRIFRPFFAWYGSMDLLPHVWNFIGLGNCEVKLHFHEPKTANFFSNRKEACSYCYEKINKQFYHDLSNNASLDKIVDIYSFKSL